MEVSYEVVFEYLRGSEYPDGADANKKRAIRKKAKHFVIKDGILFYSSDDKLKQWITSEERQKQIVESCHADKLGGHLGRDKTREKVSSRYNLVHGYTVETLNSHLNRYYWRDIISAVNSCLKSCVACQRVNKKLVKSSGSLHSIPVNGPWHRIGIDLIGPLPLTKSGNAYIITCSDYFTKWPEAAPIPDKSADTVSRFLYKVICRHGSPKIIQSDQGREFVNKVYTYTYELAQTFKL